MGTTWIPIIMKANIKLQLKTLTPIRVAALLGVVSSRMAASAHFTTPPVPYADMESMRAQLMALIAEATDGSRQSKYQRDDLVEKAKAVLRQTADYVRMVAQSKETILNASGFEMARIPQPIGRVSPPTIHEARMTGRAGEVTLRWSGVHGRRSYNIFVTQQDPGQNDAQWTLVAATGKVTYSVAGLAPFQRYWFAVSALGPQGESAKSDPAQGFAA